MNRTLERLPDEILLLILSNLSWMELLTSLWPLNRRFTSLLYSILSRIDSQYNNGFVIGDPGLSSKQISSSLFSLSSLTSCIRRLHFDETNSNICDSLDEYLFDSDKKTFRFPNLRILSLTQCFSMKPFIDILPLLIKHQLDELILTFDQDYFKLFQYTYGVRNNDSPKKKLRMLFNEFMCQLFSSQCRLTSLQLDIDYIDSGMPFYECFKRQNNLSCSIFDNYHPCSMTLRRLYIHVQYISSLTHLLEHVPVLEKLTVHLGGSLNSWREPVLDADIMMQRNGNWFDKVPKLECFALKTIVRGNLEFVHLKWVLNNINHVKKLKLHLRSTGVFGPSTTIWNSALDANFIRQYCLPDEIKNLTHFDFDIFSECKLPMLNTEQIVQSFQTHPVFVDHQWTNVKCFYNTIDSYQYVYSSLIHTPRFFDNLIGSNDIYHWPHTRHVSINLHPSLYEFLQEFNELFPNVYCIKVVMEENLIFSRDNYSPYKALIPFEMGKYSLSNTRLRNVTRLDLNSHRIHVCDYHPNEAAGTDKDRAKLLAYLISMPIQLKDLRIEHFQWLLHIVQYASDELRKDALHTVRYAEFSIPSCHWGSNEFIRIGQNLVPFLSRYMPRLQTLRLWRPDDFPWTSIRPDYRRGYNFSVSVPRWYALLPKRKSIEQHVTLFQHDLSQLIEQMKELVFLDIRGEIHANKVQPYQSMVQTLFPYSRCNVGMFRMTLWL